VNTEKKRMAKSTIQDVARLAGVGTGTVSRVLNDAPNVREATRLRVEAAVERLDYKPDLAARALRSRRTGSIGLVLPSFTKHFYVEVLHAITRVATAAGLSLIVFSLELKEERERVLGKEVVASPFDGLIVVSLVLSDREIRAITSTGRELVLIDATHSDLSSVEIDHAGAAYLAVKHLIQLGHRRIGFIGRSDDPFALGFGLRLDGYRHALAEAGIEADDSLLVTGDYSRESGLSAMESLLKLPERPSAIFASSDLQAIGAMEVIRDYGLRVPEDIAIVGYNDIELAEYIGLTTIRLPTSTIGDEAVRLLREALDKSDGPAQRVCLQGELVVRRTCGGQGVHGSPARSPDSV
jgi:DNA-binding LacI/PurR family transcriptional regulator